MTLDVVAVTTAQYSFVMASLNQPVAEEVRYATDVETPTEALLRAGLISTGKYDRLSGTAPIEYPKVFFRHDSQTSLWLFDELERVSQFRKYLDNWDGYTASAPKADALDAAEILIGYFSSMLRNRRPKIGLDSFGNPSFFLEDGDLYFHLTLESSNEGCILNWLAEKGGRDCSGEDVLFNGQGLPDQIRSILSV